MLGLTVKRSKSYWEKALPPLSNSVTVFYSKNCSPSEVESILVCPIEHFVKIFKASGQKGIAGSYAEVPKGRQMCPKSVLTHNNSRIFWLESVTQALIMWV